MPSEPSKSEAIPDDSDPPDRPRRRTPFRRALVGAAATLIVLVLSGHACAWCASFDWRLELATHFVLQRALAIGLACVLATLAGAYRTATLAAFLLTVDLFALLPFLLPGANHDQRDAEHRAGAFEAVTLNLRAGNAEHAPALAFLRGRRAEFVAVQELTPEWLDALRELEREFPYSATLPQEGSFGIGLFSKAPIRRSRFLNFGEGDVPSLEAVIGFESGDVTALATHPPPPVNAAASAARDRHLAALAEHVRTIEGPVIVVGDLNATPWSPPFRNLLAASGLRDGRVGRGLAPTWPARFGFFGIPIDHVLTSEDVRILDLTAGPNLGSDHRPICFEFVVDAAK